MTGSPLSRIAPVSKSLRDPLQKGRLNLAQRKTRNQATVLFCNGSLVTRPMLQSGRSNQLHSCLLRIPLKPPHRRNLHLVECLHYCACPTLRLTEKLKTAKTSLTLLVGKPQKPPQLPRFHTNRYLQLHLGAQLGTALKPNLASLVPMHSYRLIMLGFVVCWAIGTFFQHTGPGTLMAT